MASHNIDQNTLELGRLVAAEFRKAAGYKKPVEALGIRMKDGFMCVGAVNDHSSPLRLVMEQLKARYGDAADNIEHMTSLRDITISITGRLTTKAGAAKGRIVTINGAPSTYGWTSFTG